MNILLKELIETFERLSGVYNDLLDTAKTKHKYLISGNIEGLEMILYQEKNLTEIAGLLEKKRQNIVGKYCRECGIKENNITITTLINKMDATHGRALGALVGKLEKSITQLQDINENNATLTHYSLDVTEDIMRIFCSSPIQYATYQHSGKMLEKEIPMVLIDTKI